jgi:AraC-like DNA-binding protein
MTAETDTADETTARAGQAAPSSALQSMVQSYLDCWRQADIAGILAHYSDTFQYHDVTSGTLVPLSEMGDFLNDTFAFGARSSIVFHDIFYPSQDTVFIHWTQTVKLPGAAENVSIGGVELLAICRGKIASVHEFYDYKEPDQEPEEAGALQDAAQAEQLRKLGLIEEDLADISARAKDFLARNDAFLDPDISLIKVADALNITRNQLSYVLNNVMQSTFYDWVNSSRIGYVLERMKRKDAGFSVVTIAMEAGFNSISGFYGAFKKQTGVTPSAYRKALLAEDAADSERTR